MFGTIPGDHWRVVPGVGDPKLTHDSAQVVGQALVRQLHLTTSALYLEDRNGYTTFDLSSPVKKGRVEVTFWVLPSAPEIRFESRYFESGMFGNSPDKTTIEGEMAQQILIVLRGLYPHSTAKPYMAYAGPLGP